MSGAKRSISEDSLSNQRRNPKPMNRTLIPCSSSIIWASRYSVSSRFCRDSAFRRVCNLVSTWRAAGSSASSSSGRKTRSGVAELDCDSLSSSSAAPVPRYGSKVIFLPPWNRILKTSSESSSSMSSCLVRDLPTGALVRRLRLPTSMSCCRS